MALFEWENGTKTQNAIVTGDGVTVQDAVWEGETPISASNLNASQQQVVSHVENEINNNLGTKTDTWSSASSYSVGDRVIYAGGVYKNLTGNNSSAPNTDTTNWELVPIVDTNGHINEQDIYSTTETKTNKVWINNKPIYRKVVNVGNLPNRAEKQVAHGIANIENISKVYGFANDGTRTIPLPFPSVEVTSGSASASIYIYANNTNITLGAYSNRSALSGYVIIEYTKTS